LENKGAIADRFAVAAKMARNKDVEEKTRKLLEKQEIKFSSIDRLSIHSRGVNWPEAKEQMEAHEYPLSELITKMQEQIRFAEEARKQGPKLMKEIPGMIKAMEKKLAKGKLSANSSKYIAKAQTLYAQAQDQSSGMNAVDWGLLYLILLESQTNIQNAETANSSTGSSWDSSPTSDNSSSSSGFGDSGGFGGGSFDSGSGSTGSW
jgi:uncharacterized membrane protein YgcG